MAFDRRSLKGRWQLGSSTEAFGTAIVRVIPPKANGRTVLSLMRYTTAGTAHTLSVLRCQGTTTTTAASSSGGSTITIANVAPAKDLNGASLPENLAASDYLVVENTDGSHNAYLISSINTTTKVVTITGTLAKDVASGANVYAMYEVARTAGIPSIQITTVASTTEDFPTTGSEGDLGIASSLNSNEPLLIHSNNATATGVLRYACAIYSDL